MTTLHQEKSGKGFHARRNRPGHVAPCRMAQRTCIAAIVSIPFARQACRFT